MLPITREPCTYLFLQTSFMFSLSDMLLIYLFSDWILKLEGVKILVKSFVKKVGWFIKLWMRDWNRENIETCWKRKKFQSYNTKQTRSIFVLQSLTAFYKFVIRIVCVYVYLCVCESSSVLFHSKCCNNVLFVKV